MSLIDLPAKSLAEFGDDEQIAAQFETFLNHVGGPYAVAVTPPSAGVVAGLRNPLVGGVFFLSKVGPDVATDDLAALNAAIGEGLAAAFHDAADWQHDVVVDDDWLAINAVPSSESLDDVSQDLLASDQMYQWVRPGFVQHGGNFYLNVDTLLSSFSQGSTSNAALAAASPVRVVGASWQIDAQGDTHGRLQVMLAPH